MKITHILMAMLLTCSLVNSSFGISLLPTKSIENATQKFIDWVTPTYDATVDWLKQTQKWTQNYAQAAAAAKPIVTEEIPFLTKTLFQAAQSILIEINMIKDQIKQKGDLALTAGQTTTNIITIANYLDDMLKAINAIVEKIGSDVVKPVNADASMKIIKVTSTINYLMEIIDKQTDLLKGKLGPLIQNTIQLIIQLIETAQKQPMPEEVKALG